MSVKLVIFDLDGTLFGETLFSEAELILAQIHSLKIHQSLATFNPHAAFYCQRYGLNKYFDKICSGRKNDHKLSYIQEILRYYQSIGIGILEEETLFVDDDPENIQVISSKTKINCIKVTAGGIKVAQIQPRIQGWVV